MAHRHDVVIIGGGPGGSTLAALLTLRGRKVLVIERERFPRFHIGESLLPMSCEVFDKLDLRPRLDERFLRKYGATFVCSTTGRINKYLFSEAYDKRYPYAYQVPRADFDKLLLDRAIEVGAQVLQPTKVLEVIFDGERAIGVRARNEEDHDDGQGEPFEIFAPLIVDATGRGAMMASHMRVKRRLQGLDTSAVFAHYRNVSRPSGVEEGHIRIIIFDHGWMWMIPFRGDVTSVGAVIKPEWMRTRMADESLESFFDRTLACAPFAIETLRDAERISPVRSAADFSYGVSRVVGDGWLCVGDACGFIDPLFSTGAHLAIKGADLAVDAIDAALGEGDTSARAFERYEAEMRSASSMFLGVVQAFYHGEFREMLFATDQRRILRTVVTSMLSGDVVHRQRRPSWARFVQSRFPAQLA
jgi:flavin-dependent dehydrogenase